MDKILLAMNAHNVKTQVIDFACYLTRLTNSRLTGLFLEEKETPMSEPAVSHENIAEIKAAISDDHIRRFTHTCESQDIQALVHHEHGIPLEDLLAESRYADLLVADPDISFSEMNGSPPGKFIKDTLHQSECPVVIAPYSFHSIDEIFFAYHPSVAAAFAIRQFTYLFPAWKNKKITIVNVQEDPGEPAVDVKRMRDWLEIHYRQVELLILHGDPANELFGFLLNRKNAIVVLGAYGRSRMSRLLKPSHAQLILRAVNLPLFIAHK